MTFRRPRIHGPDAVVGIAPPIPVDAVDEEEPVADRIADHGPVADVFGTRRIEAVHPGHCLRIEPADPAGIDTLAARDVRVGEDVGRLGVVPVHGATEPAPDPRRGTSAGRCCTAGSGVDQEAVESRSKDESVEPCVQITVRAPSA